MTYQRALLTDRYAQAALSVANPPELWDIAMCLYMLDKCQEKPMTQDHLKQIAAKWSR